MVSLMFIERCFILTFRITAIKLGLYSLFFKIPFVNFEFINFSQCNTTTYKMKNVPTVINPKHLINCVIIK